MLIPGNMTQINPNIHTCKNLAFQRETSNPINLTGKRRHHFSNESALFVVSRPLKQ